jgi:prostaglandin-H2 D-isomerase / glutathione transferase
LQPQAIDSTRRGTENARMAKYKLTYFDFSGSRGEECRLALFVAGVEFEDHRISQDTWKELKASTPYGALPVLETPGKPALAQSNAILAYVGRRYGLHPTDAWEAARHEAILVAVEELRAAIGPSGKIADAEEKKKAREELSSGYLQTWGRSLERQITGPFVAGERISVADIKLFQIVSSFKKGVLDHIPTTVFAAFPRLEGVYDAVARHPKIVEWRSQH